MLDRLVLADRPVEDYPLLRKGKATPQGGAAQSYRFGGDQDALGVQPVQDAVEAFALLADAIERRNRQVFDEQQVRVHRLAPHLVDLMRFDEAPVKVGVEERQAVGRFATCGGSGPK